MKSPVFFCNLVSENPPILDFLLQPIGTSEKTYVFPQITLYTLHTYTDSIISRIVDGSELEVQCSHFFSQRLTLNENPGHVALYIFLSWVP